MSVQGNFEKGIFGVWYFCLCYLTFHCWSWYTLGYTASLKGKMKWRSLNAVLFWLNFHFCNVCLFTEVISFHFSICPGTARRAGRLSTDFPSASITPTTPIQNASIIVTNTNTDCQQIQRTNNYKYKVSNQQYNGTKSITMTQIQIQSTGKCKYIYRNA